MKNLILQILQAFILCLVSLQATAQAPTSRGMYFDGADDYAIVFSLPDIDLNFTIEAWVKLHEPLSTGEVFPILTKDNGSAGYSFAIRENSGNAQLALLMNGGGTGSTFSSSISMASFANKQWHHVAVTRGILGGPINFYLDGASVGGVSVNNVSISTVITTAYIGANLNTSKYFKGQIDELRFFTTSERTSGQINLDMSAIGDQGAQYYWDFEAGTGQTISNDGLSTPSGDATLGTSSTSTDASDPLWALRVKNTSDAGLESFRQALTDANTLAGKNYIDFSIPTLGPWDISINTTLSIQEAAIVDATSQPGWEENTLGKRINIYRGTGFSTTFPQIAFDIGKNGEPTSDVEIYGLRVLDFNSGPDGQDVAFLVNNFGNRDNIKIGAQGKGNVTSNCKRSVTFFAPAGSTGNVVAYNRFGTNETGTTPSVVNDGNNDIIVIYAPLLIEHNVITKGISIFDGVNNNIIRNNKIGTGITGTENFSSSITATSNGIRLGGGYNIVRDNVIANFTNTSGDAIQVWGHNNQILFNRIGIGTGGGSLANVRGINFVTAGAGGGNYVKGNIISNNTDYAIVIGANRKALIAENEIYCNTSGVSSPKTPLTTITGLSGTTLSGTAGAGDSVYIYKDNAGCTDKQGKTYIGRTIASTGSWTYTFPSPPAPGDVITAMSSKVAAGDSLSSPFSAAFVVPVPVLDFYTLGPADWTMTSNWSNDGTNPCSCSPNNVPNANVRVRHDVSIGGSATVDSGTKIDIQNPVRVTITNPISLAELKGVSGAKIRMYRNVLPNVTNNLFATTPGTIVEFAAPVPDPTPHIPLNFGGNNFRNLHISGSGGLGIKSANGDLVVEEDFKVLPGGTFHVLDHNFTVKGNTEIAGTFTDNASGGVNTFKGIIVNNGTFSKAFGNNSDFIFENDITNNNQFSLNNDGSYTFNKPSSLTINNNSSTILGLYNAGQVNCDVIIQGGVNAGIINIDTLTIADGKTVTNHHKASIAGVCNGATATSTWVNATNSKLTIEGTAMPMATGVLDATATNNQVIYSIGNQDVKATNYDKLFFGNGSKTLSGNITVQDTLSALDGATPTLNLASHTIDAKGAFVGSNTTSPMAVTNGTVRFSGTSLQTISRKTSFDKIEINNPSNVQIAAAGNTANAITFTQGRLQLGNNDFTLTASNPLDQITQSFTASSTSYVETNGTGRLVRNGLQTSSSYVFPIGDASSIRHITIKPNLAGNAASNFVSGITPAPGNPPNNDQAAGMWLLSGLNSAEVTFENTGCISPNSKVNYYDGSAWSSANISTTYNSPAYIASGLGMDFSSGKTFTVFGAIPVNLNITPATIPNGVVGAVYDQIEAFNTSGGFSPYTFSIISGNLPAGLVLNTTTNRIEGTPTEAGTFTFTLQVQDNALNVGTQDYTLTIDRGIQSVSSVTVTSISANSYSIDGYSNVGLALSYFSTDEEVATVSGNVVTVRKEVVGEAEIKAFHPGDANYLPSDTVTVIRINNFGLVSAIGEDLEKSIKIYPNPSTHYLTAEVSDAQVNLERITLLEATGKEVTAEIQIDTQKAIIQMKDLPKGVYVLRMQTSQGTIFRRIVKI